jgi:uncharacterized membrane protein YjgN (DUF898 family)
MHMNTKYNTEQDSSESETADAYASGSTNYEPQRLVHSDVRHAAARGFGQAFALHPILALTAIVTDCMVSAVDVTSLGVTAPFLWLIASTFIGVIVFLGQKKWAGDDAESAFIKALIVSFLTAIPTPLPSFLTIPSGVVGLAQSLRRKS